MYGLGEGECNSVGFLIVVGNADVQAHAFTLVFMFMPMLMRMPVLMRMWMLCSY